MARAISHECTVNHILLGVVVFLSIVSILLFIALIYFIRRTRSLSHAHSAGCRLTLDQQSKKAKQGVTSPMKSGKSPAEAKTPVKSFKAPKLAKAPVNKSSKRRPDLDDSQTLDSSIETHGNHEYEMLYKFNKNISEDTMADASVKSHPIKNFNKKYDVVEIDKMTGKPLVNTPSSPKKKHPRYESLVFAEMKKKEGKMESAKKSESRKKKDVSIKKQKKTEVKKKTSQAEKNDSEVKKNTSDVKKGNAAEMKEQKVVSPVEEVSALSPDRDKNLSSTDVKKNGKPEIARKAKSPGVSLKAAKEPTESPITESPMTEKVDSDIKKKKKLTESVSLKKKSVKEPSNKDVAVKKKKTAEPSQKEKKREDKIAGKADKAPINETQRPSKVVREDKQIS